jgi:hypothetical protein
MMSIDGVAGEWPGGIWLEDKSKYVAKGVVESGYVVYDLPDDKVAMTLMAEFDPPLTGSVSSFVSVDAPLMEDYTPVGYWSVPLPANLNWPINQMRGKRFQVRFELGALPNDDFDLDRDSTPTLGRWTLKAYPAISTGIEISVVLIMDRAVVEKDLLRPFDPYAEYDYLENLRQQQQIVQYVEGPFTRSVLIQSLDWLPNLQQVGGPYSGYNAYLIVYLESLPN